jgi:hypothetical protein
MKKFFKELKQRWVLESPPFFKKVGKIGAYMAFIGGAYLVPSITLSGLDVTVPVQFPAFILTASKFLFTAGTFIKITAKLAVTDTSQIHLD